MRRVLVELERTSLHEASHVVVGLAEGLPVLRTSILRTELVAGLTTYGRQVNGLSSEAAIAVALAGDVGVIMASEFDSPLPRNVAQGYDRYFHRTLPAADVPDYPARPFHDDERVAQLGGTDNAALVTAGRRRATRILRNHWTAVLAVAEGLLRLGTLDESNVSFVLALAGCSDLLDKSQRSRGQKRRRTRERPAALERLRSAGRAGEVLI